MYSLLPEIKQIINRSRHQDENLLVDTDKAGAEIVILFEKNLIIKTMPTIKYVNHAVHCVRCGQDGISLPGYSKEMAESFIESEKYIGRVVALFIIKFH